VPVIELAIFDCDGVLVDSERLTNTVFAGMLNELGLNVTLEDMFERFVGNSTSYCLDLIQTMLGRPVPEGFLDDYRSRYRDVLTKDLQAVSGVREAIEQLTIPYCVASSGDFEKMRLTLGITGLLPFFEGKMFSVIQVPRGKPEPDVFLFAAGTYGIDPSNVVVIEDTPVGVTAGVRAGMTVLGYAEMTPAAKLIGAGARSTFHEMSQLPVLIELLSAEA